MEIGEKLSDCPFNQRFYSETSSHLVAMAGTQVDLNKISVRELGMCGVLK